MRIFPYQSFYQVFTCVFSRPLCRSSCYQDAWCDPSVMMIMMIMMKTNDDNDSVDDAEDVNPNHLDQKLLYEILCHRVDVTRPVNLATDVGFDDYHLF